MASAAVEWNSKKKRGRRIAEKEDRISSLPDCVLIHILSYLPTKTSVSTSILSNRWRHIWKHVSILDFSNDFRNEFVFRKLIRDNKLLVQFQNFSDFVNRVFSLRMPCYPIEKMSLSCFKSLFNDKLCTSSVDTWVRSVIGPHLKELSLDIYPVQKFQFQPPIALFTCPNLVSLSLIGKGSSIYIDPEFVEEIRLPSLKYLKLHLRNVDIHTMNGFLVGCPILETLDTYLYNFYYNKLCVPSTLKRLKISSIGCYDSCLKIDLHLLGFDDLNTTQITLQNVVKASLAVFPSSHRCSLVCHLLDFLNALSGIKHLSFSLKLLPSDPSNLRFPEFRHLLHLELILPWFNPNSILSLLQACPMLQVLIIQNNDKKESTLPGWIAQSTVPNCIVSHLTYIQFKGYEGFPDELLFAEYILQNGLVLKKMNIAGISVDILKYYIIRRLSDVPRGSRLCQLTFD